MNSRLATLHGAIARAIPMPALLALALLSVALPELSRACDADDSRLAALELRAARGFAAEEVQRIELYASGCVALSRPKSYREPGRFRAQADAATLEGLKVRLAAPALRDFDLDAAVAAARIQRSRGNETFAHYVGDSTHYRLQLGSEAVPGIFLKLDDVPQLARLYAQSSELVEAAALLDALLALDALPSVQREPQP